MSRLTLLRCATPEEVRRARLLREFLFAHRRGIDFDTDAEADLDAASLVLLLERDGDAVGTARVLPLPSTLSAVPSSPDADSEVSRVAAVHARGEAALSLCVLALGALWVLEHTDHRTYVAHCHPALVRLYRMVGARDTGRVVRIPGRAVDHHALVGTYADCALRGLRLLGLDPQHARSLVRAEPDAAALLRRSA